MCPLLVCPCARYQYMKRNHCYREDKYLMKSKEICIQPSVWIIGLEALERWKGLGP